MRYIKLIYYYYYYYHYYYYYYNNDNKLINSIKNSPSMRDVIVYHYHMTELHFRVCLIGQLSSSNPFCSKLFYLLSQFLSE